jgi:hypothetical protein
MIFHFLSLFINITAIFPKMGMFLGTIGVSRLWKESVGISGNGK